ncbi:hypothetical protein FGY39_08930, partial [Campylobacter coli]|nr:hypothetical protein [Campylobacter coli]
LNELLNLSYNGKIAGKKEKVGQKYSFISKGELNGEFGELQTKNFIQRYEVQFHQPNTTNCLMKKQRKLRGVNKC